MVFDVEVAGTADGAVRLRLADVVGAEAITATSDCLTLRVRDQAALVAVVTCLNDMGIAIRDVHRRTAPTP